MLLDHSISNAELYSAIFDLTKTLSGHSDLSTLSNALAVSLGQLVTFARMELLLHDAADGQLHVHSVGADGAVFARAVPISPSRDRLVASVWNDQCVQAVLVPEEESEGEGESIRLARQHGARVLVLVPLSRGERRLGLIAFGAVEDAPPTVEVREFLLRMISEFSVSVDAYLAHRALQQERDRMQVLFDITHALVSKLPMEELLPEISRQLARVVKHDVALVTSVDRPSGKLKLVAIHATEGSNSADVPRMAEEEAPVRPDGLPTGEAIEGRQPVVVSGIDYQRFYHPLYRKYVALGLREGCSIPLLSGSEVIGVLDVTRREGAFQQADIELLTQIGRQVAVALENALAYQKVSELRDRLATEKLYLEDEIRFDHNIGNMIGDSPAFEAVLRSIRIVGPTTATVLIQGETGTGKELVARALHDCSERKDRSFIKVNCAAIPGTLLESELFGHEKGSFTGAFAQKAGRFELAHQGTLFLDEIGEIPLDLQAKLLRAIQEQELERLGGNRTIRVDVRIVAATNRDLRQMVEQGKFRSDLYYRLNVFPLNLPPLRERRADIPMLIRHFTDRYASRLGRSIEEIPTSALDALVRYEWPGNIRELQNVIERSVILTAGRVLQISLPDMPAALAAPMEALLPAAADAERGRILKALEECGWRISGRHGAAERLGLRRTTLQSRMQRLNISRRYR